jgi:hypothetical protein
LGVTVQDTLPNYWVNEAMVGRSVSLKGCVEDWLYHFGDLDADDDEGWDAAEAILTPWYAELQAVVAAYQEMDALTSEEALEHLTDLEHPNPLRQMTTAQLQALLQQLNERLELEDEPSGCDSIIEDGGDPMGTD